MDSAPPTRATTVAILAGGRSRRMGTPKPAVRWRGRSLLAHAVDAARAAGLRPVVVVKPEAELPPVDVERWDEPALPQHPLCGVATALERAAAPLVVLPVDLPLVPPLLLERLASRPERLIVVAGAGRVHPLLGRFSPVDAPSLRRAADDGASVLATIRALDASTLTVDGATDLGDAARFLRNVNRPVDLDALDQ